MGSGIDYLALVEARRDRLDEARISYAGIGPIADQVAAERPTVDPNQLVLACTWEHIGAGIDDNNSRDDGEEGTR
jgi:hypothetical protein